MTKRMFLAIAVAAVCCCGCLATTQDGETTIVRHSPWIGTALIVGLLALAIVSWILRASLKHFLAALAAIVFLGTALIPHFFMTHVTVTEDGIEARSGFWLSPTHDRVRFADLTEIRVVGRDGDEWHCRFRSGATHIFPASSLLREALPAMRQAADRRAVSVTAPDQPNRPRFFKKDATGKLVEIEEP